MEYLTMRDLDIDLRKLIEQMNEELYNEHELNLAMSSALLEELTTEHKRKPFTSTTDLFSYLASDSYPGPRVRR